MNILITELTKNLPFDIDLLPQPSYLVGGTVRDALLGRKKPILDLDFIVPKEAIATARNIAGKYGAGFVVLDAVRAIARVVFPDVTLDFAQQEGEDLFTDLQRRDFTINAIAFDVTSGDLIDPLHGQFDLQSSVIKMISRQNLIDDPLRLLRAYRQAGQLGFTIEENTRLTIKDLAPNLAQVAAERVKTELDYLCHQEDVNWLISAFADGLFTLWFPDINDHNFQLLLNIQSSSQMLQQNYSDFPIKSDDLYLAKFTCLLSVIPENAELQLTSLKSSRNQIKSVLLLLINLPIIQKQNLSIREQYVLFKNVGDLFPTLTILALASGVKITSLSNLINHYLNPDNQIAHPTPLITGKELMTVLKLPSSPKIGLLLTEIAIARAENKINTPSQALELAEYISKYDSN
jgi:tRNA nucleotidyltransferase (CCA-adding enzyme)